MVTTVHAIQANQNLESWSLADIYGTLVAQEKEVVKQKTKTSLRGPLALMSKEKGVSKEYHEEESKRKSKKAMIAEDDKLLDSDSDEDINTFAKSLALITHQFNKKVGNKVFEGRRDDEERRGNQERRFQKTEYHQEPKSTLHSDQKGIHYNIHEVVQQSRPHQPFQQKYLGPQRYFQPQPQKTEAVAALPANQNDGRCFRCGKPRHFSANCRGRLIKDQDYYKNKYKYNVRERVLVAEMEDWISDSTSDGEEEPTNLYGYCRW
ncbi:hypothetical protein L6452_05858 [Arctium lappa]|uniref:Uncharacterized protein n=1 Tax=Arctium lappa TaxID=4217 RepID=A0ACB9EH84_ARCLA|nr:hypothetical protein L6452_05858 [Arctium lappa]